MNLKQVTDGKEVDQRLNALLTNVNAVRAVASAVEGTIGPKGMDTMLVDNFGSVTITNDGVTILEEMEATHPAARMVINTARAQEKEVGDGTTTATIWAGALVTEGLNQVMRGVPVARVLEGMRVGIRKAISSFEQRARAVQGPDDPLLYKVALIAGRGQEDIAELIIEAARMVGREKLLDSTFRLRDCICAVEGLENQVFEGVLITKGRLNKQMPQKVLNPRILIIDDALAPEEIEEGVLTTEAGVNRYLHLRQEFQENLLKIINLGVKLVLVDRRVDDCAEEMLTDAGVMVVRRVLSKEWRRAAEHTGAWPLKRTGLRKPPAELERYLGSAQCAWEDEEREQIRIEGGTGKPFATILVGAATEEVVGERERIARDAASAVQAALKGGVVPGGGSVELAVARDLEKAKSELRGMAAYGLDCVIEALKRPFTQIVTNAGFNALEKLGDVVAAQVEKNSDCLGIDCDSGEVCDLWEKGVLDPVLVKIHALKVAGELAEAILRIDTIIRRKDPRKDPKNCELEQERGESFE